MTNLFHKIDQFGTSFSFTIEQSTFYNTIFGGILTIITCCLFFIFFWIFGADFFQGTNAKISVINEISTQSNMMKMIDFNYTIAFELSISGTNQSLDLNGGYMWSYGESKCLKYSNKSNSYATIIENFPIKKCKELSYAISQQFPDHFYCIEFDDHSLLNSLNTSDCSIQFFLSYCEKKSSNGIEASNCKPFEYIKRELKTNYYDKYLLNIHYPALNYNSRNKKQPATVIYNKLSFAFDYNLQRTDYLNMHQSIINDDNGWLFSDYENKASLFTIESFNYYHSLVLDSEINKIFASSILYSMYIQLKPETKIYVRSYMKIHESITTAFVFVYLFTMLFQWISTFINKTLIFFYIFQQMHDLFSEKKGINYLNSFSQAIGNMNNNLNNSSIIYPIISNFSQLKRENSHKKISKSQFTKCFALKHSIGNWVLCGSQRKLRIHYDRLMKKVKERMELSNFINIPLDIINIKQFPNTDSNTPCEASLFPDMNFKHKKDKEVPLNNNPLSVKQIKINVVTSKKLS